MQRLEEIIYSCNTYPKAFLVGFILEISPMNPVHMKEKLEELFPYLNHFSFLRATNFRNYCVQSLSNILEITPVDSGHESVGVVPGYALKDSSIQGFAKFILAKSAELGVNPEDYLTTARNSKKESNMHSMGILIYLYKHGKTRVDEISKDLSLNYRTISDNLLRLEKTGMVQNKRFPWAEQRYSYEWIKGKLNYIDENLVTNRNYLRSIKRIANLLSETNKAHDYQELQKKTGNSRVMIQVALRELEVQGLIQRTSAKLFSHGEIQEKGAIIVKKIINPMIKAYQQNQEPRAEPTKKQLIQAMENYEQRIAKI